MRALVSLLLLCPFFAFTQVEISTDSTLIRIGEQIKYSIQVEADSTQLVLFPEGQTFMPMEAVEATEVDTLRKGEKVLLTREYSLTQFDSGSYTIPSQRVSIGGKIFLTDSMMVEVRGVEVDTTKQKLYEIKPMIKVDKSTSKWWLYLLIGLAVLGLIAFLVYYFFIRERDEEEQEEEVYMEPYERAKLALKKLDEAQLLERNEIKAYYSELTLIIRKYLDEKVYDRSMESTTQELVSRLKLLRDANKLELGPETIKNIETILRRADLVKFARSRPEVELAQMDRGTIDEEIDHVKESLPEPTPEEKQQDVIFQKEQERKKQRRLRIKLATAAVIVLIGCYLGFSFHYGFRYVKDSIFGHPTKELLEKKEWIRSEYGAPGITLSTPEVLERQDSEIPEEIQEQVQVSNFRFGSMEEGLEILVSASKYNEEALVNANGEKISLDPSIITEKLLQKMEESGVQNILPRQEKFVTPLGQEGIITTGIADFPVPGSLEETTNANYALIVFATENISYTVSMSWDPDDPYTDELIKRVQESIEITGLENQNNAGGN